MLGGIGRFGDTELDILREIGNIGAGHAATALSKLLGRPIEMAVPRASLVPFGEIAEKAGGEEAVVAAVYFRIEGDAPGNLFFLMPVASAERLLAKLTGREREAGAPFSEMEISALSEIANILAGSYLTSLSDFTKLTFLPTIPGFAVDMAGAILNVGLLQFGVMGDCALLIETALREGSEEVGGRLFMIPDPDSFATIFTSLGVPPP